MKVKKVVLIALAILIALSQSIAACTIIAVGKDASVDGSTMTSHTCDSNSDDVRMWLIPSMDVGTERDIVLSGRKGADYSNFPAVKDYGVNGMVLGSYTLTKPSNQYVHAMYSFINDKGLAMGESTCSYNRNSEQGKRIKEAWSKVDGVYDCYMLQDLALETCSTAREAVEFMGSLIDEYGWNGYCECINICDGNETWVFEAYGGNIWCAVRIPDDAVFVAANRARIINIDFNDNENYKWSPIIKSFALENNLWDGTSPFEPANIYCYNKENNYGCTLREWRVLTLLDPTLDILPPTDPSCDVDDYPLYVVPKEKVSVATIHKICSDYYAGTEYDCSRTVQSGPYGNPLSNNNVYRPINMFRCTYIQIANVKAYLPEEARCLAWVGWGAPSVTYLTPVFASQTSFPSQFGKGLRAEAYNTESAWKVVTGVQQEATVNYDVAIEVIRAARDQKLSDIYETTAAVQNMAAALINAGQRDTAVKYLTSYAKSVANDWHSTYIDLDAELRAKLMFGNVDMKVPKQSQWWLDIVNENLQSKLKPLN